MGHCGTLFETKRRTLFSLPSVGCCGSDMRSGHEFTRKRNCIILVRDDSAQANFRFNRGVLALTRHLARLMTTRAGIVQRAALSTMTRRAASTGEGWMRAEPRRTTGRKSFTLSHQRHAGAIVAGLGESSCSTRKVKWTSLNGEKREFYVLFSQLQREISKVYQIDRAPRRGQQSRTRQSQLRFEHISYRSRTTAHLLGLPRSGSPGIVGQGSTNMSVDEKNAAKKEDSWHSDEAEATPWCTRQLMGLVISNKAAR